MNEKTEAPQPKNPYRLRLSAWMAQEGYEDTLAVMEEFGMESVVPALCTEGCEVEPDGKCEHKCPSVMLVLGVI